MGRLFIDARRKYPEIGVLLRRSWDCAPACVDGFRGRTHHRPPLPIRIRGGRAVGVIQRERFSDDTSRQGRESSPPPPSPSAPPPGGDSPSIHCQGGDLLTTFSVRYFPEIPFPSLPRLSRICHHAPPAHRMEEARLKRRFTTVVIRWRQTMIELV